MKKILDWDNIEEAGQSKPLLKGIYGLKIINVVDVPDKEYLEIYIDITKGDFAGYFERLGENAGKQIRSYKQSALPFFKSFVTAVEKSNSGYHWDFDEKSLVGKNVIGVFGEEEYVNKEGKVAIRVALQSFRSLEAFKEGKIKVPELKKMTQEQIDARLNELGLNNKSAVTEVSVDDLPF